MASLLVTYDYAVHCGVLRKGKKMAIEIGMFDELANLTEQIVFDEILELLEAGIAPEISASRINVQDVAAIALNKLPSKYVCDPLNKAYGAESLQRDLDAIRSEAKTVVLKAVQKVLSNPHS